MAEILEENKLPSLNFRNPQILIIAQDEIWSQRILQCVHRAYLIGFVSPEEFLQGMTNHSL